MKRKIIFLDVDGTLVDYDMNIPESAVKGIQLARINGHKVYICTGRSKAEVYKSLWEIGLDGMIGGNGSYVEDHEKVVMHQMITEEDTKKMVDYLHSHNLEFYLESNSGLYASEYFQTRADLAVKKYSKNENITVREAFPEMIYGEELYRNDVNKISFCLNNYNDYMEAREAFKEFKVGTWGGKGQEALFGDIALKGITKDVAIEQLLKYLDASIEDTIAFGDADIDISMLDYYKVGVAMGNGSEGVKEIADYVTTDVEDDGLWNAFKYFELI